MKLVPYNHLEYNVSSEAIKLQQKLTSLLHVKYNDGLVSPAKVSLLLEHGPFQDKSILLLGCGANDSAEKHYGFHVHDPWFPRALELYNVKKVVGVDVGSQNGEPYKHLTIDLTKRDSLQHFKDNDFDIACAFNLFNHLESNNPDVSGIKVFNQLQPQLERIVKPEGVFIFSRENTPYEN